MQLKFSNKNRGASFIEVAITLPIFLIFVIGIIDLTKLTWTRSSVRSALSYAVKKAESDPNLLAKFNNPDGTISDHKAYQTSRDNIINEALTQKLNFLHNTPGVTLSDISHLDDISRNHVVKDSKKKIAVLPPGTAAYKIDNTGKETLISNSHVCPVYAETESNKNTLGQSSETFDCPGKEMLNNETIAGLSMTYPFEVMAEINMKTFLFGEVKMPVSVASFKKELVLVNAATKTPNDPEIVVTGECTTCKSSTPTPFYPFPPTFTPTTAAPTNTPFYPTLTPTNVPPTSTATNTPVPPTATPTSVPETSTPTNTPTNTPTATSTATLTPTMTNTQQPTNTRTPTPTTVAKPECVIYAVQRGPGAYSRWNSSSSPLSNVRYPAAVYMWIGDNAYVTKKNWQNSFHWENWNPAGWWHNSDAVPATANLGWGMDPCNRNYKNYPACQGWLSDPPSTVTYNGFTYNIKSGSALGGECMLITSAQLSPLVIDMAGKGLNFTKAENDIKFDFGNGKESTSWIANGQDVAFLALDRNGNGKIDDIKELFGNRTPSHARKAYKTGFEALEIFDANKDGVINSADNIYAELKLWFDRDANGESNAVELVGLESAGITEIKLKYDEVVEFNDMRGSLAKQKSTALKSDGKSLSVYDAWFSSSGNPEIAKAETNTDSVPVPKEGQPNYEKLSKALEGVVVADKFSLEEFPYENGTISTLQDTKGQITSKVATWPHKNSNCDAKVTFNKDLEITKSSVECF